MTEVERRGYHRLAAKGHMTDQELVAALSELNEIRETAERELEAVRARGEALKRLEHDRDALMESYAGIVGEILEDLAPEERHHLLQAAPARRPLSPQLAPGDHGRLRAGDRRGREEFVE
jgi:hypothetical protein